MKAKHRAMKKIALIGECMIELSYQDSVLNENFGGDTLNTAIYLKRTASDLSVNFITALGTDSFSQKMKKYWESEGIVCDYVLRDKNRLPGLYIIETDNTGERNFLYWRNDSAAKYWMSHLESESVLASLKQFDAIYLSGISLAILSEQDRLKLFNTLMEAKTHGVQIIFDNNYRPRLWPSHQIAQQVYQQILDITDIAFITADDDYLLWSDLNVDQIISRMSMYSLSTIVIKQGSLPCIVVTKEQVISVEAKQIDSRNIIDTTAAGDSFSAGFLAAMSKGCNHKQSAEFAHNLASTVIQHKGAIIDKSFLPVIES